MPRLADEKVNNQGKLLRKSRLVKVNLKVSCPDFATFDARKLQDDRRGGGEFLSGPLAARESFFRVRIAFPFCKCWQEESVILLMTQAYEKSIFSVFNTFISDESLSE